ATQKKSADACRSGGRSFDVASEVLENTRALPRKDLAMKFLMTYTASSNAPPSPETMAAIGQFTQEMTKAGVVLMTGGLQRPSKGTRLRSSGGKHTITHGPFAETKELIDGFALIKAKSREEAVELAQRFMSVAGEGEGEVLQVFDAADIPG